MALTDDVGMMAFGAVTGGVTDAVSVKMTDAVLATLTEAVTTALAVTMPGAVLGKVTDAVTVTVQSKTATEIQQVVTGEVRGWGFAMQGPETGVDVWVGCRSGVMRPASVDQRGQTLRWTPV